jgi:phosphoribosylpyrophosphate synthetase
VRDLLVTDSIEPRDDVTARLKPTIVSIASLLATAIQRLLDGGSLRIARRTLDMHVELPRSA